MKSVLNKSVFMFERVSKPANGREVNLLNVLQTSKYKHLAEKCSQITDSGVKRKFKADNVPVISISATYKEGYHAIGDFKEHTGLLCLDLDGVPDIVKLKSEVCKLPFVAYCGLSISGGGLYLIVPIPKSTPEEHKLRYDSLENYFVKHFGIVGVVDPQPKAVTALRFVSYDASGYFNHEATTYSGISESIAKKKRKRKTKAKRQTNSRETSNNKERDSSSYNRRHYENISVIADIVERKEFDFAPDYGTYLEVAFALAEEFGESGRALFHRFCKYSPKYDKADADDKYTDAIHTGSKTTLASLYQFAQDYGLIKSKAEEEEIPTIKVRRPSIAKKVTPATKSKPNPIELPSDSENLIEQFFAEVAELPEETLSNVAREVMPELDSMSQEELEHALMQRGKSIAEARLLILSMRVCNIICLTSLGDYCLAYSTPF